MSHLKISAAPCVFFFFFAAGCHPKGQNVSALQAQQTINVQQDSIQKIVTQTEESYKAMDNPTLLKKLAEQSSRLREPFNSIAYRELKGRKDVNTDTLASMVRETKNGNAILPLLLLRSLNERTYKALPVELRSGVLTDALQRSKTFNMWGLPHLYLEEASKALLECDKSALPALERMLSDTLRAPVYGSQVAMESIRYHYRLCDYALFFIEHLQGDTTFVMPLSPADRDALIKGIPH